MTTRDDAADALAERAGIKKAAPRRTSKDQPDELLPPPETKVDAFGRVFMRWPEHNLEVQADHIERLTGARAGIQTLLSISMNGRTPVAPFRLNVHSPSGKKTIKADLKGKLRTLDVDRLIEHICTKVGNVNLVGEPIDLTSYIRPKETAWLLEPFVRARQPYLLYADGDEGKSTFGMGLAIEGGTCAGVFPGLACERPFKTMVLDWESDEGDAQEVMELLCAGANTIVPAGHIIYRPMAGPLEDHIDLLQEDVAEHGIEFIITDSIVAAASEDVREATAAQTYFRAMRSLHVASLGITHLTKEEGASRRPLRISKPFGSAYYFNLARAVWRLRREQEPGESWADIGLFHEKFNRGEKRKPLGFRVAYSEDAIQFTKADVPAMPQVGKSVSVADQIREVLKGGALPLPAIYEELPHLGESAIRMSLHRQTKTPRFINLPDDTWGLVTKGDRDAPLHESLQEGSVTVMEGGTPSPPHRYATAGEESLSNASSLDGESLHAPPKKKKGRDWSKFYG